MPKYNIEVKLPITYLATVEANSKEEALSIAKEEALNSPMELWNDDFSRAEFDFLDDENCEIYNSCGIF